MGKLIIQYDPYNSSSAFADKTVEDELLKMIEKDSAENIEDHIIDTSTENMLFAARVLKKENRLNGMDLIIRKEGIDYPIDKDGRFIKYFPDSVLDDWLCRIL